MAHAPSRLCLSDLRRSVPCKYRALQILACSPHCHASYPLPVRQASALPSASFRFAVARDTLAVRLTLLLAECVEDFHLQVRAPCRAHQEKRRSITRAAFVGGGGGTADPSLSRRAGLCLHPANRMRGVLSVHHCGRILVPARCASSAVSRPMSLYRAGLRFALFLPLGVAIPPAGFPPCGCRVRRCEPRCHSALAGRGDYLTNRTRVRKRYTCRTTCLASSLSSRSGATDGQATPVPVT